jgi:hypothetical protein
VVSVFSSTLDTTALHSMNPTHHINDDLSSLSNELHDLIDAHVTTLTQEHVASFDPSHPHSSLLRFLHTQFSEHLEQQLHSLRLYTNSNQRPTSPPTRRRRYLCYAVRKGRARGIFYSWDECRLHVEGVSNEFKGFYTVQDAQTYLSQSTPTPLPE